ncbi:MAG: hypothetical protein R3255_06370, partial [Candidatus Lokiarchaeia archaeon]|nr:hypothetical protein [Candidatus Lokiarchaeia archaeon]
NWMGRNVPRFAKTVIKSGVDMLHSMGMTKDIISDEMKYYMENGIPDTLNKKLELISKKSNTILLSEKPTDPVKTVS